MIAEQFLQGSTAIEATVFVVEDDGGARASMVWLLESAGLRVRAFPNGSDFLAERSADDCGCAIIDMRLPGMSGLQVQSELQRRQIPLPVILVTGYGDIASAVRAVKAGAVDFLQKPFSTELLLERIYEAIERNREQRQRWQRREEFERRLGSLTPREREVMDLMVSGLANKVIAAELGISERTVEAHRKQVMMKMRAVSFAQLVRLTVECSAGWAQEARPVASPESPWFSQLFEDAGSMPEEHVARNVRASAGH